MEVREFHPYDLEGMQFRLLIDQLGGRDGLVQYAMALKANGDCFTAAVDGQPIACIGLTHFWENRKYAWAFLADDFCKAKFSLTKSIHRWLKYHGQGRIETAIHCNDPKAIRWAEGFGFVREGTMRRWMMGEDYFLYARIG